MYVLGVAGYSGCGKTTLIEKLLPRLRAAGLDIAVIKHTHHDVQWDTPGKDSWRHREAGAAQVMLVTPRRRLLSDELPGGNDLPLMSHVAMLRPCDLVLAEGFKQATVPKIEVYDSRLGKPRLHPDDPNVLALVCDQAAPSSLPVFLRDDADGVAAFILSLLENFPHVDC
ncbi:molybdopterin-guanine dinucleotide biosynthesis protein B [uncultured Aquitalea sp.]|uniref:molybdopterin-guanine dinucleotide biosynthesis protein B n=1 Tax=uncultured Aquitalea sp. TaxID=540272 RepID=UPI0025F28699|nr:molybdopterin-guanine dinucleotide biosynthesis protein B [uncultured Aquitalea sp.]